MLGLVRRAIRNLIRSPLRTGAIVAILLVSIGLALIMITVHGATENQLGSIEKQIGTEITVPFLAKPRYNYFTIFYDDGHCPSTARASEWPPVVSFRWLQRDTFATAQADYS